MLGLGSTFSLTLPIALGEAAAVVTPVDADSTIAGRVLLAEDGADNRTLVRAFLRKTGVELVMAADGRAAVHAADEARSACQPFDLVLMDLHMPVLDGLSATRQLREGGHAMPVVAVTAAAFDEDRRQCLEAGFDGFLAKPLDRNGVVALVRRYLAAA
jgi:CheY-like chemotaxis protein